MFFFSFHCNPSPACIRTTHPRKRSVCTVTLIGWLFFVQPIAVQCGLRRGRETLKILGKKHNVQLTHCSLVPFAHRRTITRFYSYHYDKNKKYRKIMEDMEYKVTICLNLLISKYMDYGILSMFIPRGTVQITWSA